MVFYYQWHDIPHIRMHKTVGRSEILLWYMHTRYWLWLTSFCKEGQVWLYRRYILYLIMPTWRLDGLIGFINIFHGTHLRAHRVRRFTE